jgi:putative membrane protein
MTMSATSSAPGRFEVRVTSDSHFGWLRTRAALERTFMAWIRTAVSLIGFGFTIVQFFERLQDMKGVVPAARPLAPRYLGLMLIGAGVVALIISSLQYRRLVRYLWSDDFKPIAGVSHTKMPDVMLQTPSYAVAIGLTLIGLFAFISVWLRAI